MAERFSSTFFGALAVVSALLVIFIAIAGSHFVTQTEINNAKQTQQQQSALFENRLCSTLDAVKALQPPPGNPATNPSRAFDQEEHAALSQLASDLNCPAIGPTTGGTP